MSHSFPDVEPWPDLEDDRLLTQTLKARTIHPHLAQVDEEQLERWVAAAMPSPIMSFFDCTSDGDSSTERRLVQFDYTEPVHCRPEVSTRRAAHVVHHLLHQHNVNPGVVEVNDRTLKYQAATPGDDVTRITDRALPQPLDSTTEQWRDGDPSEQTTATLWVNGTVGGNIETAAVLRTLAVQYRHRSRRRHANQRHLLHAPRSIPYEQ